jgi:hypothetical protein
MARRRWGKVRRLLAPPSSPEPLVTRSFSRRSALVAVPVLALIAVASCAPVATRPNFPDIRFTQEPKIRLDVAAVDVERVFRPTLHQPQVEHLFPVPPEIAAEAWAHDRLEAANPGSPRRVRVRILDASVKEVPLKRTEGLRGAFTTDQSERYDATIEMAVDILGERGFPERSVTAKAERSQSVKEGITPNEREQVWYELTRALMADIDRQLESEMRANFNYFIVQ